MQAANQARDTAASVADALTDLQFVLVGLYANDPAQMTLDIGQLAEQLSAIAHAAEHGGARALPNVTLRLVERLLQLQQQTLPVLEVAGALEEWVQLAMAYLEQPASDTAQPLIDFLNLPLWDEALSQGQIAILNRLFEIDMRPAPPPSRPIAPPPAPLDDHQVAALLDVTATVPAPSAVNIEAATIEDGEATVLAEMPRELLLQLAAAAAAADAAESEVTSTEPTVQVAALVLEPMQLEPAVAEQVVLEDIMLEEAVTDGLVDEAGGRNPQALTSTPDFEIPGLPAVADPSTGWVDATPGSSIDEPSPIPSLPGSYEGDPEAALRIQHAVDQRTAALPQILSGAAWQDWDEDVLADYDGEVPLPIAGEAPLLKVEVPTDSGLAAALAADECVVLESAPMESASEPVFVCSQMLEEHLAAIKAGEPSSLDALLGGAIASDDALEPRAPRVDAATAYPGLPPAVAELIAMIHEELTGCMPALSATLESAATAALTGEAVSLEDYRWQVERLSSAAQSIGLNGLHEFLSRVLEGSCLIESAVASEVPQQCEVLDRWPPLVDQYLQPLANAEATGALVEYITSQDFAMPLDAASAATLATKLAQPAIEAPAAAPTAARARQATAADVSLAVPDDIHPELLDSLLHELPAQTQEFSSALQRVAAGMGAADDLRVAQRIAHTLKGSANTVGIRGIAELAHHLEDIFLALQEHSALPPAALARTLVDAADCLEAMSEALLGVGPAPTQALQVLQEVLDWANHIDTHGIDATGMEARDIESHGIDAHRVAAKSTDPAPTTTRSTDATAVGEAEAAPALAAAASDSQSSAPTLRVASTHVDDLLRLSGENRIVGGQLKEGVRRLSAQLQAVRRQNQLFQQLVSELEQLVDIRGVTLPTLQRHATHGFDALEMDQYSELHTVSRRLTEASADAREWSAAAQSELRTLEDLLLSQARHGGESQEAILKMRMVPASTIVGRLQRGVRQTCRLLDKDVALSIKGEETLVDSDSLNQLVDPLMHLMRNAIDHGIEVAGVRTAQGKPAQGHLAIEFGREGTQIFVRCIDDGKGLDYAAIRATALNRGLINAEANLSNGQLARLILEPGFSTRTEVTQVSGRGIGLDIVHSRVLELKGSFDLQSEPGRGCRFTIRLPATLLSAHALLVRHGEHTVAIASRGVRQILDAQSCKVALLGTRLTVQVGREIYEAHALQSLLGQPLRGNEALAPQPALLVEVAADRICAVLVNGVVDTIDVVVKPLGAYVPRSVGVVGATILGDGSVAPVVDLPDLLRAGARAVGHSRNAITRVVSSTQSNKPQQPTVLVVDDSLSVRRSMEQLLRDSGYQVRLARDGMEAVAMIEADKPDLVLVDLEMPRMNGMELTAHVRNRAETRSLPVIMITSRSTEKHRKQAETAGVNHYMTKPFTEDTLLAQMDTLLKRSA